MYDINLLDKNGVKITKFGQEFRAEVILPIKRGREVKAVKYFYDENDSSKNIIISSQEIIIDGHRYQKFNVKHFSVYGVECKDSQIKKDKQPDTSALATNSIIITLILASAYVLSKKEKLD